MSTIKEKKYSITFTPEDNLDVRLLLSKSGLQGFVLSYRAKMSGEWLEVFRVDTAHGFLHMQRFWESAEPIELDEYASMPIEAAFDRFLRQTKENWKRYREYVERGR